MATRLREPAGTISRLVFHDKENMSKKIAITAAILWIILLTPGDGRTGGGPKALGADFSMNAGVEKITYEEDEPVTGLKSKASTYNVVAELEARKAWSRLFIGFRGAFPLVAGKNGETWTRIGAPFQTNELENRRTRVAGHIGYLLAGWFNPYAGINYSRTIQNRSDFVIQGSPVPGSVEEKVISTSLLIGARGRGNMAASFQWFYGLEFLFPLSVDVTNSSLPGFKADDTGGHAYELRAGILRMHSDKIRYGLTGYGGKVHWDGSGFKQFSGGQAKWPENDTLYLGALITLQLVL
jgi:hypothetical protein